MNIKGYSEDCNEIYNISTPPPNLKVYRLNVSRYFPWMFLSSEWSQDTHDNN
jgi:hypothetical protein